MSTAESVVSAVEAVLGDNISLCPAQKKMRASSSAQGAMIQFGRSKEEAFSKLAAWATDYLKSCGATGKAFAWRHYPESNQNFFNDTGEKPYFARCRVTVLEEACE